MGLVASIANPFNRWHPCFEMTPVLIIGGSIVGILILRLLF